jgi:hypothetical protein
MFFCEAHSSVLLALRRSASGDVEEVPTVLMERHASAKPSI